MLLGACPISFITRLAPFRSSQGKQQMDTPSSYEQWLHSMATESPKVVVQNVGDDNQRGLFASADIFANERILFLPARSLLSEGGLQQQGSMLLEAVQKPENEGIFSKEQQVVAMIEELRQHLMVSSADNSMVQTTANMVQYEWKGDDAVALYLIACRKLKQQLSFEVSPTEDPQIVAQTDNVPLVVVAEATTNDRQEQSLASTEMSQGPTPPFPIEGSILIDNALLVDEIGGEDEEIPSENDAEPEEKVEFSSFLPHVEMLPESYPTSPLYFTEEELSRIEGTNCYEFTVRMLSQMENDWMQLSAVLRAYLATDDKRVDNGSMNEKESFWWDPDEDFDSYKWALCTIYSRSTDFFIQEKHRRVIAPLFDMMNHDFSSDVTHMMDPNGDISVFVGSDIKAGSEIFLNYGNFPNEKLLLVYGFAVSPNPFDAVQIYAPIPTTDPLYASKAQFLVTKCDLDSPNCAHSLRQNQPIPESLLWSLRLVGVQSQQDLALLMQSSLSDVVSQDNEYNALMALSEALHLMTRRLALNMISDANLRAASGLNPIVNNITTPMQSTMLQTVDDSGNGVIGNETSQQNGGTVMANPNIVHSKILCQSEYRTLQTALAELASRLELLQTAESPTTDFHQPD